MSSRRTWAGRAVAAAAVCALVPAATAAAPGLHGNNFFSNCRFSHTGADDPIVHPGHPGASHPHTFFGNASTDAFSTVASLRRAATTCRPASDTAAYWVPTLFRNGREVRPAKAQLYYVLRGYDRLQAFPAGLRIVAGDQHAMRPQGTRITFWSCGGRAARTAPAAAPPARCPVITGSGLMAKPGEKPRVVHWRTPTSSSSTSTSRTAGTGSTSTFPTTTGTWRTAATTSARARTRSSCR